MERTELYENLAALCGGGGSFVMATIVEAAGSTPREIGAKMVVLPDGSIIDTIGGGKIELQVIQDALDCLRRGESRTVEYELRPVGDNALGMLCGGQAKLFLDVHGPEKSLVIVGAGHIAQKLCPMAKVLGYRVVVLDGRSDFATRERFPDADEVICEQPSRTAAVVPLAESSLVVIVTHGHIHDEEALRSVIASPASYVGMIGSRTKVRAVLSDLAKEGVDQSLLARVQAPIGLDLGGHKPAEIAVSILSEIVAHINGKLESLKPAKPVANRAGSVAPVDPVA